MHFVFHECNNRFTLESCVDTTIYNIFLSWNIENDIFEKMLRKCCEY